MSRFPFPMPFGWFKVALPEEVPDGEVVRRHYFGTELILWRDATGSVVCQEAYCPHLGAHLGVGGTVEHGVVRCPFHGWAFDGLGSNVEIPYAERPNARACLHSYPVQEHAGIVFAWYHPGGGRPLWDLMEVPEHDDEEYGPYQAYDYTVRTCLQEMGENGFDHAHFQFVHSHPRVGHTELVEFDGYDRRILTSQEFPSSKGPVDARIDVFGRGPGFAITRYRGLIDASLIGCSTPVDDDTVQLTFLFTIKHPEDEKNRRIAEAFIRSVTSEVGQDIPIWENKCYRERPALAPSEKPIMDWRRWFQQFYASPHQDAVTAAALERVRLGITVFLTDRGIDPAALGAAVEERGFSSLFLPEHTHLPLRADRPPALVEGVAPDDYRRGLDPLVALSAAATTTSRIRLGTGVLLVAQHDPIVLAKQVATLDLLSGGRVTLGVGFGWNRAEAADHGVEFSTRRALAREHVLCMQALWRDDQAEFHGELVDLPPCWSWPKPLQRPGVPILVGGGATPAVLGAVAELAAGWLPIGGAGLEQSRPRLDEEARRRGRRPEELVIVPFGTVAERGKLDHYAELGVGEVVLRVQNSGRDDVLRQLDELTSFLATPEVSSGAASDPLPGR